MDAFQRAAPYQQANDTSTALIRKLTGLPQLNRYFRLQASSAHAVRPGADEVRGILSSTAPALTRARAHQPRHRHKRPVAWQRERPS